MIMWGVTWWAVADVRGTDEGRDDDDNRGPEYAYIP